jgi:hypothetical protein
MAASLAFARCALEEASSRELMLGFVEALALPADDKSRLLAMTPASYTGLAAALARAA